MHITSATEDFRKIADRLRFQYGDLVPVKDREGWWRVPPQLLLQEPAFVSLTRLYNQAKVRQGLFLSKWHSIKHRSLISPNVQRAEDDA